jgi:hypothetical protein
MLQVEMGVESCGSYVAEDFICSCSLHHTVVVRAIAVAGVLAFWQDIIPISYFCFINHLFKTYVH